MKRQKMFDIMATHLLTQGVKAEGEFQRGDEIDYGCAYRLPNGLKCAVGALIPDELYKPEMEGKVVEYLNRYFPSLRGIIDKRNIFFLTDVQEIHDHEQPGDWKERLKILADNYSLKTDVLDKF